MKAQVWPRQRRKREDRPAEPALEPMGYEDLDECWRLDQLCFAGSEVYDRETFRYLLSHNRSICYKVVAPTGQMVGFLIGMLELDGCGHVVAVAVRPEYRRRGLGRRMMEAIERDFINLGVNTIRLEVRTTNRIAQQLYLKLGYEIVQLLPRYYTNGEDGYLMIKSVGRRGT
jgi:ribosomal-protein-alanine N-acetyltransferase